MFFCEALEHFQLNAVRAFALLQLSASLHSACSGERDVEQMRRVGAKHVRRFVPDFHVCLEILVIWSVLLFARALPAQRNSSASARSPHQLMCHHRCLFMGSSEHKTATGKKDSNGCQKLNVEKGDEKGS